MFTKEYIEQLIKDGVDLEGPILEYVETDDPVIIAYIAKCKQKQKDAIQSRYNLKVDIQKESKLAKQNEQLAMEALEQSNIEKAKVIQLQKDIESKNAKLVEYAQKVEGELDEERKFRLQDKDVDNTFWLRKYSLYGLFGIITLYFIKEFLLAGFLVYIAKGSDVNVFKEILILISNNSRSFDNVTMFIAGALSGVYTASSISNRGKRDDVVFTKNDKGELVTNIVTTEYDYSYGINNNPEPETIESTNSKIIENGESN